LCTSGLESMYVLGLSLGYPPKACEYFVKTRAKHSPPQVFINYCGLHFGTHFDLIEENLHWLLNTYDVPYSKKTLLLDIRVTGKSEFLRFKGVLNVDKIIKKINETIFSKEI
jgi:hypothetical protein